MHTQSGQTPGTLEHRQKRRRLRWLLVGLGAYAGVAYVVLPWFWKIHEKRIAHPAMPGAPRCSVTHSGIPGDPINVALIGTAEQLTGAMQAAGWYVVDPTSVRSGLRIAEDVLLDRPYLDAPVSNLFVWGRRQDAAFEQPVGTSPRQRHHVRFWRSPQVDRHGRHLWLGAATFDRGVGFSHDTWQITHHIAPDLDAERDKIMWDLRNAGQIAGVAYAAGIGKTVRGRNGGGDLYYTDGRMAVAILLTAVSAATRQDGGPL